MNDRAAGGDASRPPLLDPSGTLIRNIVALFGGVLLWTMCHFGILAVLPLFLHEQGWDARAIGFALGASGVAQVCVRPFAGWLIVFLAIRRAPRPTGAAPRARSIGILRPSACSNSLTRLNRPGCRAPAGRARTGGPV